MHRSSLAPVLSATRSRDSCWITSVISLSSGSHAAVSLQEPIGSRLRRGCLLVPSDQARFVGRFDGLLGLLEDLHDAPALRGAERAGLHDEDAVADACGVLLVVRLDLVRPAH